MSACQAKDAAACRESQETFCRGLTPEELSLGKSDACIGAVASAYRDADLRAEELAVVLRLGGVCSQVIHRPNDLGEPCTEPSDCDLSSGHSCVRKADAPTGTCQIPQPTGPGRDCKAAQKTCPQGFFCDGRNCVEALDAGEPCTIAGQCAEGDYCDDAGRCAPRREVSDTCEKDAQCASGLCLPLDGQTVCTDRIVLTRAEPLCAQLR